MWIGGFMIIIISFVPNAEPFLDVPVAYYEWVGLNYPNVPEKNKKGFLRRTPVKKGEWRWSVFSEDSFIEGKPKV
jgi:hypothetical protein